MILAGAARKHHARESGRLRDVDELEPRSLRGFLRGRDRSAPIPFGPYLAAAGWLAMMYGDGLLSGYLRLSGLNR